MRVELHDVILWDKWGGDTWEVAVANKNWGRLPYGSRHIVEMGEVEWDTTTVFVSRRVWR